jgi:hypothetical protein
MLWRSWLVTKFASPSMRKPHETYKANMFPNHNDFLNSLRDPLPRRLKDRLADLMPALIGIMAGIGMACAIFGGIYLLT